MERKQKETLRREILVALATSCLITGLMHLIPVKQAVIVVVGYIVRITNPHQPIQNQPNRRIHR